jgi:hypothetical protein
MNKSVYKYKLYSFYDDTSVGNSDAPHPYEVLINIQFLLQQSGYL